MKSIVIGVAGGSGSGKSTFTNRIKKYFGDDVVVLYHDNYYRSQDGIPFEQRVTVNYDHPDALETDLLVEHLKKLKAGESIECPVYDFTKHTRSSKVLRIDPKPVILVEGILLLADPRVRESFWTLRSMWRLMQMSVSSEGFPEMWKSGEEI